MAKPHKGAAYALKRDLGVGFGAIPEGAELEVVDVVDEGEAGVSSAAEEGAVVLMQYTGDGHTRTISVALRDFPEQFEEAGRAR